MPRFSGRIYSDRSSLSEDGNHYDEEGSSVQRSERQNRSTALNLVPNSKRLLAALLFFALIALLCLGRLVYLQIIKADEYGAIAESIRTTSIVIEPRRGTIYDRNGVILATSIDATTIYANPHEVENVSRTAQVIASIIGGEAKDYIEILTAENTYYSLIERKADVDLAQELKNALDNADLPGIYFVDDSKRIYPNDEVGGQIVGACSLAVDEENNREYYEGICGLELYYNDILAGEIGYYEAELGRDGTPIAGGLHESLAAVDGQDIILSIDIELQRELEEYLTEGVASVGGSSGTAVVMDAESGEIYAAASLPLFNPSDRSVVEEGATTLKAVTGVLEPGSVFKTVTALAILETDTLTPDDMLYCPSSLEVDEYVISDAHSRGGVDYTFRDILAYSSNVGIALSADKMGFSSLYNSIITYGLHTKTGIDYPNEVPEGTSVLGLLSDYSAWSNVQKYNVAFGQGVSVTPMQIARFYCAVANDGNAPTPHFLIAKPLSGEDVEYRSTKITSNTEAVNTLVDMLESVVDYGTGTAADIEGFNVAGKTSTAEIYDEVNGGYQKGIYNLAFCGFLVDASAKLLCYVGAYDVPSQTTVTPIFQDIMSAAIDRFGIVSAE